MRPRRLIGRTGAPRDPVEIAGPRRPGHVVVRPLNFTVRAPMAGPRRFLLTSLLALAVPVLLYVAANQGSLGGARDFLIGCGFMAAPQLVVLVAALLVPSLRQRFASAALLSLTALVVVFQVIISSSDDLNSPMLWMFYLPASLVVLAVVVVRDRARGSNNRWRGP